MKEGSENLNPIIFGQLGPIWSQGSKKQSTLAKKSYGITYHTALNMVGHIVQLFWTYLAGSPIFYLCIKH